jgi:hypothetical protein
MVSPRAEHGRDSRLPPGDKAGSLQVRARPPGNHHPVRVSIHERVHCDGGQVVGGEERTRQVRHYDVLGHHFERPHAAEDTDRA